MSGENRTKNSSSCDPYVFVCYSRKDMERIRPILKRLKADNVRLWYDVMIDKGDEWSPSLMASVKNCSALICNISKDFINS